MTTLSAPISFSESSSDLGYSYVFAEQKILTALRSRFALSGTGLASLRGDLAGTGSRTLRITDVGGAGFQVAMDALATETSAITPKAITSGYSTVTIGDYGIGHSETYVNQSLSRESGVSLDRLISLVPNSWQKTMNQLITAAGAGIGGTAIGSTGSSLTIDNLIDLATVYEETDGALDNGLPITVLAPQQITQAKASAAAHDAYKNSITEFSTVAGLSAINGDDDGNFLGLGFRVLRSSDVEQASSAHQGFSITPGAMGWARANTAPIQTANPARTMYIPEFGLLIEELTSGGGTGQRIYNARSYIGVALASTRTHVQRKVVSQVV